MLNELGDWNAKAESSASCVSGGLRLGHIPLGIQIAQCRQYLHTLGPNVGIICILGSLGYCPNPKLEEHGSACAVLGFRGLKFMAQSGVLVLTQGAHWETYM